MPRPRKNGLDYFPLDVDFLDDPKIKILKARYGRDGIVFYTAYDDDGQAMYNCVAWMPLPEPYRERE